MDNCNKDITTRVYKKEDLYDGMFIQSFGNKDYIYKITINDGRYYYSTTHRIVEESLIDSNKFLHYSWVGMVNMKSTRFDNFKEDSDDYITWCETFWTRKLNKDTKREDILIELGI